MAHLPKDGGKLVIIAIEGPDSPDKATFGVLGVVEQHMKNSEFAELGLHDGYSRSQNPPIVNRDSGQPVVYFPKISAITGTLERSGQRVNTMVIAGPTPAYRWELIAEEIEELIDPERDVAILLGTTPSEVPHTRRFPVSLTSEAPELVDLPDVEPEDISGTVTFQQFLSVEFFYCGIPTVYADCCIPEYASLAPSPKAALTLLSALEDITGLTFDPGDMTEDARAWTEAFDSFAESDPELGKRVASLELAYDRAEERDGDAIAREFEKFLRRREEDR